MQTLKLECMEQPPSFLELDTSNEALKKVPFLRLGLPSCNVNPHVETRVAVIHPREQKKELVTSVPNTNSNTKSKPK